MPTYEYECKSCGHRFDCFQSIKDEPLKICPKCSKELRRLIYGGSGIIFKGNGFYITDKGSAGGKTEAASISNTSSHGDAAGKEGRKSESDSSGQEGAAKPKAESSGSQSDAGNKAAGSKAAGS